MLDTVPAPFESAFAAGIYEAKYRHSDDLDGWPDTCQRTVDAVMGSIGMADSPEAEAILNLMINRQFIPGGRYLYAAGRDLHQVQNCALYRAEDTREGWSKLAHDCMMSLMTGAGVGCWYGDVRASGAIISRTGGVASGPISLMKIINEIGRNVMQGGSRRSAIWAGLPWWHPDIFKFIVAKDWSDEVKAKKADDFSYPADLDMTNISVTLDKAFFMAFDGEDASYDLDNIIPAHLNGDIRYAPDGRSWGEWAHDVYDQTVTHMVTTAEPGFSVDYDNPNECLRNACTEVTSEDNADICNLGSLNLARFGSMENFREATNLATLFLLAGTVYSDLPHAEVYETREKNRRLGLGLMGVHEWLLVRGKKYGPDADLGDWLERWELWSDVAASVWSERLGLSKPVKVRAIAPNGTIGILAETTTGAECVLSAAYKRRVRISSPEGDRTVHEYVVDPTAARLVAEGVDSMLIEDAYSLSYDIERRMEFQAWLQQYVDHGISSTLNLPCVDDQNFSPQEFGQMLYKYLPKLRGITCYPDGSRGGQPLTSVPLEYALDKVGVRFEENEERCVGGLCGT